MEGGGGGVENAHILDNKYEILFDANFGLRALHNAQRGLRGISSHNRTTRSPISRIFHSMQRIFLFIFYPLLYSALPQNIYKCILRYNEMQCVLSIFALWLLSSSYSFLYTRSVVHCTRTLLLILLTLFSLFSSSRHTRIVLIRMWDKSAAHEAMWFIAFWNTKSDCWARAAEDDISKVSHTQRPFVPFKLKHIYFEMHLYTYIPHEMI